MKSLIIVVVVSLAALQIFAADITCNGSKKTANFAVKSEQGEPIEVAALESGGSAYIWHSVEKLKFSLDVGQEIGSGNTRTFTIDPNIQTEKAKRYTFRLAQAWTPSGNALAVCTVLVKK